MNRREGKEKMHRSENLSKNDDVVGVLSDSEKSASELVSDDVQNALERIQRDVVAKNEKGGVRQHQTLELNGEWTSVSVRDSNKTTCVCCCRRRQ